jgi:muramoyltetrapeptide carboxypeptidase
MAHIYIYSPSSSVRDKAAFRRGVKVLQSLGHDVEIDASALAQHMRFAGDDAARIAAVSRAAASGANLALTTRGGYGLTRILPGLPYKAIAKSIERGMQWVGISDFTALQMALLAKTGAPTWAGPALGEDFGHAWDGSAQPDDIMLACFDDLVLGQGEGAGWQLPKARNPRESNAIKNIADHAINTPASGQFDSYSSKKGMLWGGTLSVICSLLGTPYMPQVKNGILFVEDVGDHPYRIERMLTQLLHAGVLATQQAVVLGQFTNYKLVKGYDRGFGMPAVAAWLRTQMKIPVFEGLPFGHVPTKVVLPVGMKARLHVQEREALIFWG